MRLPTWKDKCISCNNPTIVKSNDLNFPASYCCSKCKRLYYLKPKSIRITNEVYELLETNAKGYESVSDTIKRAILCLQELNK